MVHNLIQQRMKPRAYSTISWWCHLPCENQASQSSTGDLLGIQYPGKNKIWLRLHPFICREERTGSNLLLLLLKKQHPKNSDFFQDAVAKSKDLALIHISCVRFLHLPETTSPSSRSGARRSTSEGYYED